MICRKNSNYQYEMDVLRVLACFLVVWQHVTECYYILPGFENVSYSDKAIVSWINSLTPIEVPLFVMISGYLLLPMKTGASEFFRRRVVRVLLPFFVWCVIYALYYVVQRGDSWHDVVMNILHIPVNFGTEIGHMWFIYMITGLYILTPVISPWLNQCSKRQLQCYLLLWGFTNCLPYIHLAFPAVLGECFWNPSPMLYYFTGFAGYYVLGFYIKRYGALSFRNSFIVILIGYAITVSIFRYRMNIVSTVSDLELSWRFCSINISMMAFGVFSVIKNIKWKKECLTAGIIKDLSAKSYAIYFVHLMVILFLYPVIDQISMPLYFKIPLITVCSFLGSYLIISILYLIPKAGKWIG